jgi:hypothetical protein
MQCVVASVLLLADTLRHVLQGASKATPISDVVGGFCELVAVKVAADLHQRPVVRTEEMCGDVMRTSRALMDYWRNS